VPTLSSSSSAVVSLKIRREEGEAKKHAHELFSTIRNIAGMFLATNSDKIVIGEEERGS
jgi:hypothetical protein